MIPEAWRPTPRVRQHRVLIRRRCKVQNRITSVKNSIRGILTRYNKDRSDLFTIAGRESFEQLSDTLLGEDWWVARDLFTELKEQTQRLRGLEQRLHEFAEKAPIREQEARAVLETMPGMGLVTTETVLAELGDWTRFRNADAVVSYLSLIHI